ncbi:hypothetical protein, partial [Rhizobium populisoli]|uniref:hypothetical protein n=1 Tax=Rhizobium populisoli TaxID=2859785 RepID=UPI001FE8F6BA
MAPWDCPGGIPVELVLQSVSTTCHRSQSAAHATGTGIKIDGVERPFAPASRMPIVVTPIATRQREPLHGEDYHNWTGFGQV